MHQLACIGVSALVSYSAFGADPLAAAACVLSRDVDAQDGWCGAHWGEPPAADMTLAQGEAYVAAYTRPHAADKLLNGIAFSGVTYSFICNRLQSVFLDTIEKQRIVAAFREAYGDPYEDVTPTGRSELTWKGRVVSVRVGFDPDHAEAGVDVSNDEMLLQASQMGLRARVLGIPFECPSTPAPLPNGGHIAP